MYWEIYDDRTADQEALRYSGECSGFYRKKKLYSS